MNTNNSSESSNRSSCNNSEASPPKKHKQWDETSMIHAMEAVKSSELRVNQAAKEFDVPPTTLKDRISGRVRHGRKPRTGTVFDK